MKLMYISSEVQVALAAEAAGVDWIFVDLEILGKIERQGHLDTVISRHSIEDVECMRSVLTKSQLLVRINPMNKSSKFEINRVIAAGADIIMLPFFVSEREVEQFLALVDGRVQTCLLVETPGAAENLEAIINRSGIDFVHIGLNDLHLGYGMTFMFEPLANGTIDRLATILRKVGIEFGFGGIAKLGEGALPAERILAEHRRIGSSLVILSRSFHSVTPGENRHELWNEIQEEVERIRDYEAFLEAQPGSFFERNRTETVRSVDSIVRNLNARRK